MAPTDFDRTVRIPARQMIKSVFQRDLRTMQSMAVAATQITRPNSFLRANTPCHAVPSRSDPGTNCGKAACRTTLIVTTAPRAMQTICSCCLSENVVLISAANKSPNNNPIDWWIVAPGSIDQIAETNVRVNRIASGWFALRALVISFRLATTLTAVTRYTIPQKAFSTPDPWLASLGASKLMKRDRNAPVE